MALVSIILAAGRGQRLLAYTKNTPKPLLKIGERRFIDHAILLAKIVDPKKIIVVGGYRFRMLASHIKKTYGTRVAVVKNEKYQLQNLSSFTTALSKAPSSDILVCNADYVYETSILQAVRENLGGPAIFCSFDLRRADPDVMKVACVQNRVQSLSKQLLVYQALYLGIWYVPGKYRRIMQECISNVNKSVGAKKATVEYLIVAMIYAGVRFRAVDIGSGSWLEIDTPAEYRAAKKSLQNLDVVTIESI